VKLGGEREADRDPGGFVGNASDELQPLDPTMSLNEQLGDLAVVKPGADTMAASRAIIEAMKGGASA
jgi:hypothetical protein